MGLEIERRFLVIGDGWRSCVRYGRRLFDALAPFGLGKVRIRIQEGDASITFKGPRAGLSRLELEYHIPPSEAENLIWTLQPSHLILKTRYWVPVEGVTWFVDVHESPFSGLVTAEVELDRETQVLVRPPWIGGEITGTDTRSAFQSSQLGVWTSCGSYHRGIGTYPDTDGEAVATLPSELRLAGD